MYGSTLILKNLKGKYGKIFVEKNQPANLYRRLLKWQKIDFTEINENDHIIFFWGDMRYGLKKEILETDLAVDLQVLKNLLMDELGSQDFAPEISLIEVLIKSKTRRKTT